MSSSTDKEVIVTLSQMGPKSAGMTLIDRRLTLGAEDDRVAIGRTSKSISKGRVATDVNGLFDCAVMSRNHAVLYTKSGDVFIEDTTSMHGTFVNGDDIRGRSPHQLRTGDGVRFGIPINRNEDSFSPVLVTVGIEKQERQLPLTFGVPDASESELEASDAEENDNNDDFTQGPANCPQVVDLTSPVGSPQSHSSPNPLPVSDLNFFTVRQVDNIENGIIASSPLGGSVLSSDGDLDDALFDSSNNDAGDFDQDTTDNVDSDIYSEEVDPSVYDEVDSDYGSDFEDPQDTKNPDTTDGVEDVQPTEHVEPDFFGWPRPESTANITWPAHILPPAAADELEFTIYPQEGIERPGISKKRKAADISEITTEELQWGAPPEPVVEQRHAQDQEIVSVAAPVTPVCFVDVPRPSKRLRHFAAGLGYAALGGITAAAVTFGSLAYTAPSF
ncbi:hypothetical protein MCOR27_003165 [Pyricularia oryzae]|uniref:FHA domain-containing protein n=1 Tax=Pyricularia grisea TaxID=148305 RepID=A0ABQ8NT97_PYRGI|nr:hypothetical protein MCOR01_008792 [Pyricularia oryzae]KAI6301776.1 hypothetical protein MCOR33_002760 [Pyricularia grisea]KAI6254742.1 hypothetical protein MCOR19_008744 [Pyricularia oryzae]KAI6273771.1 hypothetical protein MCOR26_006777 [Pyricularia oryzae]KAI6283638.1 hypothetical protein MCOR27_003165 [Pyricularia oryzae]